MKRTDSGFHESFLSNDTHNVTIPLQRSNTASSRRRKPTKTPSGSITSARPVVMDSHRPASEDKARPSQQRSTTTSSNNSANPSRGRKNHSSKPCSRGTSRTGVDPTRPSRHYRIQSSHTVPAATSRDIDDPVALHFRSCSLFQNPSYHTHSALPSPTLSAQGPHGRPSMASRFSTDNIDILEEQTIPKESEEAMLDREKLNMTMQWTSPSTRQQHYKRIDKANSGFRGFFNKVTPRCVSGPPERFYEKDQSDVGSVRRYRLDDAESDIIKDNHFSRLESFAPAKTVRSKKKWACF